MYCQGRFYRHGLLLLKDGIAMRAEYDKGY